MLEEPKLGSDIYLIITKVNTELLQKENEKFPRNFFTNIIASIVTQALIIELLFCLKVEREGSLLASPTENFLSISPLQEKRVPMRLMSWGD